MSEVTNRLEEGVCDVISSETLALVTNEEAVMLSIAISLKRIADLLDLVVDHNSFPNTSIAVSSHTTR